MYCYNLERASSRLRTIGEYIKRTYSMYTRSYDKTVDMTSAYDEGALQLQLELQTRIDEAYNRFLDNVIDMHDDYVCLY
jgi:hypothetical protein